MNFRNVPQGAIYQRRFFLGTLFSLFLFTGMLFLSGGAEAACTDPPGPGADWQRCTLGCGYLDNLDLTGVNLAGARLREASFLRASLIGANLEGVSAHRVKFINANLSNARLVNANLSRADFTKANLSGADLTGADLRNAEFYRADLTGANLTNAQTVGADLTRADVSGATWTDGKRICKPGSIGRCN